MISFALRLLQNLMNVCYVTCRCRNFKGIQCYDNYMVGVVGEIGQPMANQIDQYTLWGGYKTRMMMWFAEVVRELLRRIMQHRERQKSYPVRVVIFSQQVSSNSYMLSQVSHTQQLLLTSLIHSGKPFTFSYNLLRNNSLMIGERMSIK